MNVSQSLATLAFYPHQNPRLRLFALWYFTSLMILWNIAGHTILGFEQAWAHPLAAVGAACLTQFFLEWVDAKANRRAPRYAGSIGNCLNWFPPAIISGFACAMLLYPNERIWPVVFASVLSIASKVLIRVKLPSGKKHHVFNPSNLGITATLLLLPWVGLAPPYQFTENLIGFWHWTLPMLILVSGIIVHGLATGRLPLCLAWIVGFVGQALFRAWLNGNAWYVPMMPMSSTAFIVFTLYMVPDPATTPLVPRRQVLFGAAVAVIYGILQIVHIVFGLFLALWLVCAVRGLTIALFATVFRTAPTTIPQPVAPQELPAGELAAAT
jgi:hypothetical protein